MGGELPKVSAGRMLLSPPTALVSVLCHLSQMWGRGDAQSNQGPGPSVFAETFLVTPSGWVLPL